MGAQNRTYRYIGNSVQVKSSGRPADLKPSGFLAATFDWRKGRGRYEAAFCILRAAMGRGNEKFARENYLEFYTDCIYPRHQERGYISISQEEIECWLSNYRISLSLSGCRSGEEQGPTGIFSEAG